MAVLSSASREPIMPATSEGYFRPEITERCAVLGRGIGRACAVFSIGLVAAQSAPFLSGALGEHAACSPLACIAAQPAPVPARPPHPNALSRGSPMGRGTGDKVRQCGDTALVDRGGGVGR